MADRTNPVQSLPLHLTKAQQNRKYATRFPIFPDTHVKCEPYNSKLELRQCVARHRAKKPLCNKCDVGAEREKMLPANTNADSAQTLYDFDGEKLYRLKCKADGCGAPFTSRRKNTHHCKAHRKTKWKLGKTTEDAMALLAKLKIKAELTKTPVGYAITYEDTHERAEPAMRILRASGFHVGLDAIDDVSVAIITDLAKIVDDPQIRVVYGETRLRGGR